MLDTVVDNVLNQWNYIRGIPFYDATVKTHVSHIVLALTSSQRVSIKTLSSKSI